MGIGMGNGMRIWDEDWDKDWDGDWVRIRMRTEMRIGMRIGMRTESSCSLWWYLNSVELSGAKLPRVEEENSRRLWRQGSVYQ